MIKLKLHKLWLEAHTRNLAAIKMYEKLGFVKEGIFKDQILYNDGFGDEIRMAVFKPEKRKKYGRIKKITTKSG